jgi:hypothetical protein
MGTAKMFSIAAALLALALFAAVLNEENWDEFAKKHNCVVTATHAGQYVVGFGKHGGGWIPATTTYRCDDGIERTR